MSTIKFQKADSSPTGKRRLTESSGGYPEAKSAQANPNNYARSSTIRFPLTKAAQFAGSDANVIFTQPMFFSPLHTPQNWQIASKRREMIQWARHYYENEPKIGAGVDFYALFPLNGFELQCKDRKVLQFYESLIERLDLAEWLNYISHDYYLCGEVFPFLDIDCPECGGSGTNKDREPCNHPGGTFRSIRVLNPDTVDVKHNFLAGDPIISLLPDEEIRLIIQRRQPKEIYDSIPEHVKKSISAGHPMRLSNRCVSHLKHNSSGYAIYGTSLLRRLFTVLAYKTKLMTANWIIAERLILPVRVVKIGDEKRPATEDDVADVSAQIAAVANDPNLTIVTHHAFNYEYYGATGKIHNITAEMELIGKEILDGLMLNQAILNGEMGGYSSAQVGVEVMMRRLENWRTTLKTWVEKKIFLPIAMMQGFYDEDKSKKTGKREYLYPKMKWNPLELRDKTNRIQVLMTMFDKQICSPQTVCEEADLDYDTEVERIRESQLIAKQNGQIAGQPGQPGAGGMPPPGGDMGGGGGAPPPGMPPGGAPPGMPPGGAPPGGDMAGGAAPPPGGAPGAMAGSVPRVQKRGKKKDDKDGEQPATLQPIKLTQLEARVYKALEELQIPYRLFGQYSVAMPNQPQPFVLDFAYPDIGVGVEADGAIWHERADLQKRDRERDQKLANVGWRILRFTEDAVEQHIEAVKDVIRENIVDAYKEKKSKKGSSNDFLKLSKLEISKLTFNVVDFKNPDHQKLGYCLIIGEQDGI